MWVGVNWEMFTAVTLRTVEPMKTAKKTAKANTESVAVHNFGKRAWTPRELPGGVYCSPACGAGCTAKAYRDATRKSVALAKKLGGGFIPHVWENLGWHYSARQLDRAKRGRLIAEVCPLPKGNAYRADLYVGGQQFAGRGRTPDGALGDATAKARRAVETITKDLAHV